MTLPRAARAAAVAVAIVSGSPAVRAADLRLDPDLASHREATDPVRWILAQAVPDPGSPARSPVSPAPPEPEVPGAPWSSALFPFLASDEPVGFAPARWGGTVAAEYLAQRMGDTQRRQVALGSVNLNGSSYFWKPWFAQVEGTVTALVSGEKGDDLRPGNRSGFLPSTALSGGGSVTLFPASRFPFYGSLNTTDSRATGEFASSDYRNTRATLRQTYRNPLGTATYVGSFDYSAVDADAFGRDTVSQLDARYLGNDEPNRVDAVANWSRNRQSGGTGSDILRAFASHLYTPTPDLWVSSLANFTDSDIASGSGPGLVQRLGQLSTQAVWRPEAEERLAVTGGARFFANQVSASGQGATTRSLAGNAGASFAITEEATVNASFTATQIDAGPAQSGLVTTGSAGATYTSRPLDFGLASYSFTAALQGNHQGGGPEPSRSVGSAQADQMLSRTFAAGSAATVHIMLTQGGGVIEDTLLGRTDQLRAGVSGGLRVQATESTESYLGASYAGSESRGGFNDRFRLANVQANGLVRLGPHASLSGNLTAQWVRSNRDLFAAEESTRQVVGGITFEHARLFGVPRLRYLLSATFNQGIRTDQRLLGDVDAKRENVTQLVDSRVTWEIGRLELRVGTRLAKVDGRDDLQWYLRVYRYIGQY